MTNDKEARFSVLRVGDRDNVRRSLSDKVSGLAFTLDVLDNRTGKQISLRGETLYLPTTTEELADVMRLSPPLTPTEARFHAWVGRLPEKDTLTTPLLIKHVVIRVDTETWTGTARLIK